MPTTNVSSSARRRTALARLEAEELADVVVNLRSVTVATPELEDIVERLEQITVQIRKALEWPGGITVAQAAGRLDVSRPTVRKWIKEELLISLDDSKPVEIDPRSVLDLERALTKIRQSHPTRHWSEALAAFIHDRDLLSQDWAKTGIEDLRRGDLVSR